MSLKKTCLFLTVAFFLIDLFLLVLCIRTRHDSLYLSDTMIEDAVAYMRSCDVSVESEVIKRKIPDNPIYTFKKDNASAAFDVVTGLSQRYYSASSVSFAETPDGVSYTVGETGDPKASFRIYNDSFRVEYTKSGFRREVLPTVGNESFVSEDTVLSGELSGKVSAFLETLNASKGAKASFTVLGIAKNEHGTLVCVSQNVYADHPILDFYINLFLTEDGVEYAVGMWILSSFTRSYGGKLIDGVNALYGIDFSQVSRIVSQNIVYENRAAGNGIYYLIPRWKIVYLDRSATVRTQYVDALKK